MSLKETKKDNYSVCLNVAIFKQNKETPFYILIYSEPNFIAK